MSRARVEPSRTNVYVPQGQIYVHMTQIVGLHSSLESAKQQGNLAIHNEENQTWSRSDSDEKGRSGGRGCCTQSSNTSEAKRLPARKPVPSRRATDRRE